MTSHVKGKQLWSGKKVRSLGIPLKAGFTVSSKSLVSKRSNCQTRAPNYAFILCTLLENSRYIFVRKWHRTLI